MERIETHAVSGDRPAAGLYPGWKVVFLAFLMTLLSAGPVFYAYSVYGQSFARTFDAPRTVINLGFTLVLVVSGAVSGAIGWLNRRWGLRVLAAAGCLSTGAGLMLVGLTTAIWQVVLLFGVFIAFADALMGSVISNALVARWFERRRGLAIGLSVMGASAAAIIYPPLTSFLTTQVGWRAVFFIHGASVLLLTPLVLRWAHGPADGMPALERRSGQRGSTGAETPPLTTRALLRNMDFWAITLPVGTLMGLNGAVMISLVPFAVGNGISQTQGALLVSAVGASALAGKLGFGFVADHVDLRLVLRGALLFALAAFTLLSFTSGYELWLTAALLFGLSLGGMLPVWGAIMAQVFGQQGYAHALGWSRTAMTPLNFGCPLLAGVIFDLTGSYAQAWLLYLTLTTGALAISFFRARPD